MQPAIQGFESDSDSHVRIPSLDQRSLSTAELVRLIGVSYRHLQWWDEHDYVSPQHEANRRLWRIEEATLAFAIAELRKSSYSLQVIIHGKRDLLKAVKRILRLKEEQLQDAYILYSKDHIAFLFGHQVVQHMKNLKCPGVLIPVGEFVLQFLNR